MNKRQYKKFRNRIRIIGIDYSNGEDYGCTTYGYIDVEGVRHITHVEWHNK